MEGFYFVSAIKGFNRHNTGNKNDDDDDDDDDEHD
jgi:hypothetical protein